MESLPYKPAYRRKLPHFQPKNTPLFVTFRLAGSIPQEVIHRLEAERLRFERELASMKAADRPALALRFERSRFAAVENALNKQSGPLWLKQDAVAKVVEESLKHRDNKEYTLDAYCIMANHVHAVFTPLKTEEGEPHSLAAIMKSLKGFTARRCNEVLSRSGAFWEAESYDHYVRSESEWIRIIEYVLNNPVKARLVDVWTNWKWSYCKFGDELQCSEELKD